MCLVCVCVCLLACVCVCQGAYYVFVSVNIPPVVTWECSTWLFHTQVTSSGVSGAQQPSTNAIHTPSPCQPQQTINQPSRDHNTPTNQQRPSHLSSRNELSLEDDLFFRNLQALKEENKRALKTLETLYNFRREDKNEQEEEV